MSIDAAPDVAPDPVPNAAPELSAEPAEPVAITITIVDQAQRDPFDESFRAAAKLNTPMPLASEAFVATSAATGDVLGVAYISIRHHLGPFALVEGGPADTFARLADAVSDQLRSTVRESLLATHADIDPAADFGLSYDVYLGAGSPAPAGFERLEGIEVWRRRVC